MSKAFLSSLLIFTTFSNHVNRAPQQKIKYNSILTKSNDPKLIIGLCQQFQALNNAIRDNKIEFNLALKEIQNIIPKIKSEYYKQGGKDWKKDTWAFPLQGYNSSAIGGKNGNGFKSDGYNFFDGNLHVGHPAHDIFIQDTNQDCKDDKKGLYVNVLSYSGGIVLATEKFWEKSSGLRGGKYIWIFDPYTNSLFYYAHNSKVLVESGQIISPGEKIATVGRSGLNAFKKRSPSHLHFTQLKFDSNFYPKPVNTYKNLLEVKII